MSISYLTNIDLTGNQLLNANLQSLGTAPSSPTAGRVYFDSTLGTGRVYNGSSWAVLDATKATGIPTSAIASFQATIQGYTLNSFAVPTANIPMGGFTLTGLSAPTAAGQPAEYSWTLALVQSYAAGISSKTPVKAVSTANIASLSGLPTIDGYAAAAGDRVLLASQTSAAQNGVWVVAAGAWSRPTTEGTTAELDPGATWLVTGGTVNGGTQWRMSTTGAVTVGTTAITIVQFSAGNSYTAGNGLTGTQTFSVAAVAGGGILVSSGGVAVDTTIVARKFSATIGDGTSTSYTVTHNLGTQDVTVGFRMANNSGAAEADWAPTTTNSVTVSTSQPLAANSLRVTVIG